MKLTDKHHSFPITFTGENTYFANSGSNPYDAFNWMIANLKSEGNTVIFTDKYCFKYPEQDGYKDKVKYLLKKLKANKLIYCGPSRTEESFFNEMQNELSAIGCALEFRNYASQHDRWWICPETKTALFGASLNTIGASKSSIINMSGSYHEAQYIIDDLKAEGVLDGTEWNADS